MVFAIEHPILLTLKMVGKARKSQEKRLKVKPFKLKRAPCKTSMEANELVACLETRLKVIARIGQQARAKVLSERETETTVNPSVRMQPGGYNIELITRLISLSLGENLRVNLPKLQLPVFDGNLQQWQEFWDIYKATIHEQQIMPAVSKLSYLNRVC